MNWVNDNDKMGGEINFLIPNPNLDELDWKLIKEVIFDNEPYNVISRELNIIDILVLSGLFRSKKDARRNWKKEFEIPDGFNEYKRIGKLKRSIFIHKIPKDYSPM